ncbi:MAG: regulatory protein RecX [Salinibacterium sp.]|nr:regulatory protein RecX [Salinibacterium sp.]
MTDTDGERIAPVTYLFGARPESAVTAEEPDLPPVSVTVASPRPEPAFVDLGDAEVASPRKGKAAFARVSNVSMHALARKGMSSREMRDYLVGREFDPNEVDSEVERLESVALLDDVALGEVLVRTLRERKGFGRSALTNELRRRQLDPTAIELALDGLDDDELVRATELAERRAPQLRSLDQTTAKRRLSAFLMRKGYSGSVVSAAVASALEPSGGPVFR